MFKMHRLEAGKTLPETDWKRPGKPEFSDYIVVQMDRHTAWETVNSILAQLRMGTLGAPSVKEVSVSFVGEMTPVSED